MKSANRLSINHYSVWQLSLEQLVDECRRQDISYVGLWREKIHQTGIENAKRLLVGAGLQISSLLRGGFFPYADKEQRKKAFEENRRAVDEAVAIGAHLVVLVCGGIAPPGLGASRRMVEDGIAELVPYAAERGIRLGIEPLHPMFAADRSVIVTLAQATELAERFPAAVVGVIIDTYHVWWDPALERSIAQAAGRIFGFHVSDWILPIPDVLNGRGLMGDGYIDFSDILSQVNQAGYQGPIEVEIFNRGFWQLPGSTALAQIRERFARLFLVDPIRTKAASDEAIE